MVNSESIFSTQNIANYLLLTFLLLFPFSIRISLLVLILYFVFTAGKNFVKPSFKLNINNSLIYFSALFYLLHILSLSYSTNLHSGIKDVETKLGFIIFPLLALVFPRSEDQKLKFMRYFVYSMTFASLVCICKSSINYFQTAEMENLFYDKFSFLMHPTYFTMYLAIALAFHFYLANAISLKQNPDKDNSKDLLNYFIGSILIAATFLTSSRAGIVISFISVLIMFSGWVLKLDFRKNALLVYGFVASLMLVITLSGSSRYGIIINEIFGRTEVQTEPPQNVVDENPVAHRFQLMSVALKVIETNPLGVGAGDVQDVLVGEYQKMDYEKAVIMRYNPHNQFLQTGVALGWPGIFSLLLMFGAMIITIRSNGIVKLFVFIALITALNGLFESVFEVQRGVLLLTILIAFLYGTTEENRQKKIYHD